VNFFLELMQLSQEMVDFEQVALGIFYIAGYASNLGIDSSCKIFSTMEAASATHFEQT
jgi:hypothetical protein